MALPTLGMIDYMLEEFSHVEPAREHTSECSYCRRPANAGRFSYSTYAHRLNSLDYEAQLEREFLRSGTTVYQPSNDKACCPNVCIRLHACKFEPKADQLRALRRVQEHLDGSLPITLPEKDSDVFLTCMRLTAEGRASEAAEVVCRHRSAGIGEPSGQPGGAAGAAAGTGQSSQRDMARKAQELGMRFLDERDGSDEDDEEGTGDGAEAGAGGQDHAGASKADRPAHGTDDMSIDHGADAGAAAGGTAALNGKKRPRQATGESSSSGAVPPGPGPSSGQAKPDTRHPPGSGPVCVAHPSTFILSDGELMQGVVPSRDAAAGQDAVSHQVGGQQQQEAAELKALLTARLHALAWEALLRLYVAVLARGAVTSVLDSSSSSQSSATAASAGTGAGRGLAPQQPSHAVTGHEDVLSRVLIEAPTIKAKGKKGASGSTPGPAPPEAVCNAAFVVAGALVAGAAGAQGTAADEAGPRSAMSTGPQAAAASGMDNLHLQTRVAQDVAGAIVRAAVPSVLGLACTAVQPGYINIYCAGTAQAGSVEAGQPSAVGQATVDHTAAAPVLQAWLLPQMIADAGLRRDRLQQEHSEAAAATVQSTSDGQAAGPSQAELMARIPHALHTGNARTSAEWAALRKYHLEVQARREETGLQLFKTLNKDLLVWRDEIYLPILDDDEDVSDSDTDEDEEQHNGGTLTSDGHGHGHGTAPGSQPSSAAGGTRQSPVPTWKSIALGTGQLTSNGTMGLDADQATAHTAIAGRGLGAPAKPRRTKAEKAAAARAAQHAKRLEEAAADLNSEVTDSIIALKELHDMGVGNASKALRARALQQGQARADGARPTVGLTSGTGHTGGSQLTAAAAAGVAATTAAGPASSLEPFGRGPHVLTVTLTPPRYTPEAHELYARFNMALHRGRPSTQTKSHYKSHLITTPVVALPGWRIGQLLSAAETSLRPHVNSVGMANRTVLEKGAENLKQTTAGASVASSSLSSLQSSIGPAPSPRAPTETSMDYEVTNAETAATAKTARDTASAQPRTSWSGDFERLSQLLGEPLLAVDTVSSFLIDTRYDDQVQDMSERLALGLGHATVVPVGLDAADDIQYSPNPAVALQQLEQQDATMWRWVADTVSVLLQPLDAYTVPGSDHDGDGAAAPIDINASARATRYERLRGQAAVARSRVVARGPPPAAPVGLPACLVPLLDDVNALADELSMSTGAILLLIYHLAEDLMLQVEGAVEALAKWRVECAAVRSRNEARRQRAALAAAGGQLTTIVDDVTSLFPGLTAGRSSSLVSEDGAGSMSNATSASSGVASGTGTGLAMPVGEAMEDLPAIPTLPFGLHPKLLPQRSRRRGTGAASSSGVASRWVAGGGSAAGHMDVDEPEAEDNHDSDDDDKEDDEDDMDGSSSSEFVSARHRPAQQLAQPDPDAGFTDDLMAHGPLSDGDGAAPGGWLDTAVLTTRLVELGKTRRAELVWLDRTVPAQIDSLKAVIDEHHAQGTAGQQPVQQAQTGAEGQAGAQGQRSRLPSGQTSSSKDSSTNAGLVGGILAPCPVDAFFVRGYTPGCARLGQLPAPIGAMEGTVYPADAEKARGALSRTGAGGDADALAAATTHVTAKQGKGQAHKPHAVQPRIIVSGWDLPFGYGSFHHEYRLDGVLVAVSVLDILPTRVASVYFFYNPDLRDSLQLGKLSALVEVWLVRAIHDFAARHPQFTTGLPPALGLAAASVAASDGTADPHGQGRDGSDDDDGDVNNGNDNDNDEDLLNYSLNLTAGRDSGKRGKVVRSANAAAGAHGSAAGPTAAGGASGGGYGPLMSYLDLNFYVHACRAMNYKRRFSPSELLCPVTQGTEAIGRRARLALASGQLSATAGGGGAAGAFTRRVPYTKPWVPLDRRALQLLDASPSAALISPEDVLSRLHMIQELRAKGAIPPQAVSHAMLTSAIDTADEAVGIVASHQDTVLQEPVAGITHAVAGAGAGQAKAHGGRHGKPATAVAAASATASKESFGLIFDAQQRAATALASVQQAVESFISTSSLNHMLVQLAPANGGYRLKYSGLNTRSIKMCYGPSMAWLRTVGPEIGLRTVIDLNSIANVGWAAGKVKEEREEQRAAKAAARQARREARQAERMRLLQVSGEHEDMESGSGSHSAAPGAVGNGRAVLLSIPTSTWAGDAQ